MDKTIIFDMDGVLVDTEPLYYRRLEAFLISRDFHIAKEVLDAMVGESTRKTFSILKQAEPAFYNNEEDFRSDLHAFHAGRKIDYRETANPHLHQTLETLKQQGWRLALASSSPRHNILQVLDELQIRDYFEVLASGNDFRESKPHPEIYLTVAAKLGCKPQNCYVVEDSTYGIQAASRAGMKILAKRDNRYGFDQSPADILFDDLAEIPTILAADKLTGFTNVSEIV